MSSDLKSILAKTAAFTSSKKSKASTVKHNFRGREDKYRDFTPVKTKLKTNIDNCQLRKPQQEV